MKKETKQSTDKVCDELVCARVKINMKIPRGTIGITILRVQLRVC